MRLRKAAFEWMSGIVALIALPAALAAGEDRDLMSRRFAAPTAPPGSEAVLEALRDESVPEHDVADGPAVAATAPANEGEVPRRRLTEDRLPPDGAEIGLGWWKVGLDWRRHPGVCLIDP